MRSRVELQVYPDADLPSLSRLEMDVQRFLVPTARALKSDKDIFAIGRHVHIHQPMDETSAAYAEQLGRTGCGLENAARGVSPHGHLGLLKVTRIDQASPHDALFASHCGRLQRGNSRRSGITQTSPQSWQRR
jgi:hypothetical protein